MEANKKLMLLGSPNKSYLGAVRSMQNLQTDPGKSLINPSSSKNFEKYEVIVENQHLQNQLKLIQWRSKTELPIVKILFYKILQRKLLNECSVLQVAIQCFPCNLNSLPRMPLYQLLYLLKESLIGFQRLFDRFGAFDITNKMVLINKNSKCRVWINQNITLNFPSRKTKLTQCEFLGKIIRIFEDKCLKSTLSTQFFDNVITRNRIVEAISYLDSFNKTHKIVMPNKLNSITESLGSKKLIQKHQLNLEKIQEVFQGHESIRKIPKFVTQLREDRKQAIEKSAHNKSYDSPTKNKSPMKTRDLSQNRYKQCNNDPNSNSKSNLTPKSGISIDNNKETKSIDQVKETKAELTNTLRKRRSEHCLNLNAKFTDTKAFNCGTEKTIRVNDRRETMNEELYFTKMPNKQELPKYRKFSNNFVQKIDQPTLIHNLSKANLHDQNKSKVQCSQLTAATIDDHYKKPAFGSAKVNSLFQSPQCSPHETPKTPTTPQTPQVIKQEKELNIFQKNKWIKRMNSLSGQNARDTINSLHDGVDTFSQQFLRAAEKLDLLGTMGKQLKGSFVQAE